jgi:hypothetical protein
MSTPIEKRGKRHPEVSFSIRAVHCVPVLAAIFTITAPAALLADPLQPRAQPSLETTQPIDPGQLMSWLPADTESVVAARGPFVTPAESDDVDGNDPAWSTRKASQAEIRTAFEQLPLELFYEFDLTKILKGSEVAYALQGTRHFRDPQGGSEVMDFEGCSIIVFEKDLGELAGSIEQAAARDGALNDMIGGTRVLVSEEKSEGAVFTRILAIPRSNILLVANNRKYLREVLARMSQKRIPRALPDQLPEWQFLDINTRFWGLRHYDPTQAKLDPSSPLGEDRTYVPSDPNAIGALFALDPNNERSLVITSLSGDEAAVKAEASRGKNVDEPEGGVKFEVILRSPKPGVLEQIYPLDRTSTLEYSILAIEFELGRGMNF